MAQIQGMQMGLPHLRVAMGREVVSDGVVGEYTVSQDGCYSLMNNKSGQNQLGVGY